MQLLVDFPSIVKHYAPYFKTCFRAADYEHFKKAIAGFIISENKTIQAINNLFVRDSRDQSTFNKFFNRQPYDCDVLTEVRLNMMQQYQGTRFKVGKKASQGGVLSIDNSLLKHYGKHFDNIYYHYDYVYKCYRWSHDLVTLYYSDDQTDYPVFYRLWAAPDWEGVADYLRARNFTINQAKWDNRYKEAQKWRNYIRSRYRAGRKKYPGVKNVYKTKLHIAEDLLRKFCSTYPDLKLPIALDSGFTSAELCTIIQDDLKRDYIGALRENQYLVQSDGTELLLKELVTKIRQNHDSAPQDAQDALNTKEISFFYRTKKQLYYTWCANHRVKGFLKKQRLVISFKKQDLSDRPRFTIAGRLDWHPKTILRHRRHRWPVETFHQEGKVEGLEDYQARNDKAIQTHITLIVVTYCMLKCAIQDEQLLHDIRQRIQTETQDTLPFLRRLMKAEGLLLLVEYIFTKTLQGDSLAQIFQPLARKMI